MVLETNSSQFYGVAISPAQVGLVERAIAGDKVAFAELVELFWSPVNCYLLRLTGEAEVAADLTQETFFKAYCAIGGFNPGIGQFRAWLYRIATNLATSHFRRQKRWRRLSFERNQDNESLDFENELPDDQAGPVDRTLAAENSREVVAILEKLPKEQVSLLLLRYYHELSNDEIAQVLELKPAAVRARLHRARAAFGRLYEQSDVAGEKEGR